MQTQVGWREYARANEDELVRQHLPLAKRVVRRHFSRAGDVLGYDDLDQEAAVALVEAIRAYDPAQHAAFGPFAARRIRWRIVDYIRRHGPAQAHQRETAERVRASEQRLAERSGLEVEDVARGAGVEPGDVQRVWAVDETDTLQLLEERLADTGPSTEDLVLGRIQRERLADAITHLGQTDRTVLALYWKEELTYAEIGKVLGVTATSVCVRHKRILRDLARRLGEDTEAAKRTVDAALRAGRLAAGHHEIEAGSTAREKSGGDARASRGLVPEGGAGQPQAQTGGQS
ncbi:MAG: sigma-70 family RNA polymerase sigma factor [bacterium]